MNNRFMPAFLFTLMAATWLSMGAVTFGGITVNDLWLRSGETFVEMNTTNTPLCAEASGWGFPDATCGAILVNGNCADSSDTSDPPELLMTIPGLTPNTTYDIDVILATDRNYCDATSEMYSYGLRVGNSAGPTTFYHSNNTPALITGSAMGVADNVSLNRISVGNFQTTASGDLLIYMDDAKDLESTPRAIIDGIVYRLPETVPTPSVITSIDRSDGAVSSGAPIGDYDPDTDPLAQSDYGLQQGSLAYSEWPIYFDSVDEALLGADYVRTFNRDRKDIYPDVAYSVTLGGSTEDNVMLMLMVDDDIEDAGGEQQAMVDAIVSGFAGAGEFQDTGYDVTLSGTTHTLSAFGKMVSGGTTYTFEGPDGGNRMYIIGAMGETQELIPGDTNGDNIVNETDATMVASNWGGSVTGGPSEGDFNSDGTVDATDASIMAANWGDHTEGESNSSVPEPSTLCLLVGALTLLLTRGRRLS